MIDTRTTKDVQPKTVPSGARLETGISGLDEILGGGFIGGRSYLVRGGPGSGKTTLGMHFLEAGLKKSESVLFITLGESAAQIRADAHALGFDFRDVHILDLSPTQEFFAENQSYDIFSPAELEREPMTEKIVSVVEAVQPQRVFIDSMTQLRYLSNDAFQFRKQALSFLRFLTDRGSSVLMTSESSPEIPDDDLQFMSDGVIHLGTDAAGRIIVVRKFRGSDFLPGEHTLSTTRTRMEVFPQLVPGNYRRQFATRQVSSGVPEIDELLNGGLEPGTITVITGPSGVGKTTLGLVFMKEAAGRGERSVVYTFEEGAETLFRRCEAVNIPVHSMMDRGTLSVVPVEPLQYMPDEFAMIVRREVEERGARIVMIDGVSGYRVALRGEDLISHLHALTKYLANMGVTVLLINEVEFITGDFRATEIGISYMADNIIFLRYLEIDGQMRKAIGVLKKRMSDFEKTLRELKITRFGIKVGPPLTKLRGIFGDVPEWIEREQPEPRR